MKHLFTLLTILSALTATATDYILPGTVWTSYVKGTSTPDMKWTRVEHTLRDFQDGWMALLQSYPDGEYESRVACYIKKDGDKYYSVPRDGDFSQPYLMYDFGLQEGEGCTVFNAATASDIIERWSAYEKCVGFGTVEDFPDLETILLDEYSDAVSEYDPTPGVWIKGIGSTHGINWNCSFDIDGGVQYLYEVSNEGDLIYRAADHPAGISWANGDEPAPVITVNENGIVITVAEKSVASIFRFDGTKLLERTLHQGRNQIDLSDKGLFLIKVGVSTQKVILN